MALAAAQSIVTRLGAAEVSPGGGLTVSAGVATFPQHGRDRDTLIRVADGALYWAKEQGKNQVRPPSEVADATTLGLLGAGDQTARVRAAASLARVVDARHADSGSHSERVALFAGRIAEQLGLPPEQVELTRMAGSLHDLGKLAIPEELLRKPGSLTVEERRLLQRHPQVGYRMLASLGVEPIADWVLHQSERWDGAGYPGGALARRDPAGLADRVRRGRVRLDDVDAPLPPGAPPCGGASRARAVLGIAVRPGGGRRVSRDGRAAAARHGLRPATARAGCCRACAAAGARAW